MSLDRDDRERAIEALAEAYPKAFFTVGKTRKPLKVGIEDDIKADLSKDANNELRFYDIDHALEWYRNHVGYQMACSIAGAIRLNLDGKAAGKITEAEAYRYRQDAALTFARIEARKRGFAPTAAPAPAPRPTALMVKSSLGTTEMLAQIEKQVASLKAILVGDAIDDSLRATLARPVLQLIKDELQTIDARF
jgi:sRNA-binding protein